MYFVEVRFGSEPALKVSGVDEFLLVLCKLVESALHSEFWGCRLHAKNFKIISVTPTVKDFCRF